MIVGEIKTLTHTVLSFLVDDVNKRVASGEFELMGNITSVKPGLFLSPVHTATLRRIKTPNDFGFPKTAKMFIEGKEYDVTTLASMHSENSFTGGQLKIALSSHDEIICIGEIAKDQEYDIINHRPVEKFDVQYGDREMIGVFIGGVDYAEKTVLLIFDVLELP